MTALAPKEDITDAKLSAEELSRLQRAALLIAIPKKIPSEMDGQVPFYGIDIINGDWTTDATWKTDARMKRARLYCNGKPIYDLTFPDTRRWLHVHFDDIMGIRETG